MARTKCALGIILVSALQQQQGLTGFGFGMVAITIEMDVYRAVVVATALAVVACLYGAIVGRRVLNWRVARLWTVGEPSGATGGRGVVRPDAVKGGDAPRRRASPWWRWSCSPMFTAAHRKPGAHCCQWVHPREFGRRYRHGRIADRLALDVVEISEGRLPGYRLAVRCDRFDRGALRL